jgi:hypothetical protein
MQEVTVTISGGPHVEPPDPAPPLPENPDLSGLRNLVEEAVDEGQKQQPKSAALPLPTVARTYWSFDGSIQKWDYMRCNSAAP